MDPKDYRKVHNALESIMQHHGASLFITGNGDPTLNTLSNVMSYLEAGGYNSATAFSQAVDSIFNSASKLYDDEYAEDFGIYFKQKFHNYLVKDSPDTVDAWSKRVAHLEKKISELVTQSPIDANYDAKKFTKDQKIAQQLTSERDMSQFLKAMSQIKEHNEQEELKKIVEAEQPELLKDGPFSQIPTMRLKPKTVKALIKKLKEFYKAQGLTFPSN
ncbi:hypothetical protein TVAG_436460 [Trichomonas vaginalis G3]|uniref:Uncharacterized protein n=1 Tax=Trichomonas vaginalis (strain ATCC PRA-98 / G3) TaxID=412133 RepID=A2DF94_TRIV3|nr:hypothetical protein TVAGG3_0565830 [Trichomonas vaginalis G3]EAY20822.1 hypothetical protein TVAG_436460 [Trichomonas vaginalis G3]KAI5521570.1 hypothetical protein TVAGG3_0565830 [Trichomonas vaginalis G3]|eukprot:XP_001581808.1 hypothetical protein [Trichomonas vaginalis G3]